MCVHAGRDVDGPKGPPYRQVIALDTRFADARHSRGGVLYTADPRDLEAADVVLVITRCGDDAAAYVQHARPGQVCGRGQQVVVLLPRGLCAVAAQCWAGQGPAAEQVLAGCHSAACQCAEGLPCRSRISTLVPTHTACNSAYTVRL